MNKKFVIQIQYAGLINHTLNPTMRTINGNQVGYVLASNTGGLYLYGSLNDAFAMADLFYQYGQLKPYQPTYTVMEA